MFEYSHLVWHPVETLKMPLVMIKHALLLQKMVEPAKRQQQQQQNSMGGQYCDFTTNQVDLYLHQYLLLGRISR